MGGSTKDDRIPLSGARWVTPRRRPCPGFLCSLGAGRSVGRGVALPHHSGPNCQPAAPSPPRPKSSGHATQKALWQAKPRSNSMTLLSEGWTPANSGQHPARCQDAQSWGPSQFLFLPILLSPAFTWVFFFFFSRQEWAGSQEPR